jgi:glycosyltransferase involved in cell wall biosynthesis
VAHHFPGVAARTQAIPIACDPRYRVASDAGAFEALATEFGLRRPYLLYAGSFAVRKNLAVLLQAMQKVFAEEPGTQLVLAGRPSGRDDTFLDGWRNAGLVVIDRKKEQDEMRALYENAEALVFPSRYEGFGLPVLEAMSCGCPVLAANSTSLPEIVGDAGSLFDPDDPGALSVMLREVLRDPARRARMRTAGLQRARMFDWAGVAAATLVNYRLAASRPRAGAEPVSTTPA